MAPHSYVLNARSWPLLKAFHNWPLADLRDCTRKRCFRKTIHRCQSLTASFRFEHLQKVRVLEFFQLNVRRNSPP